ncbi:LysE family translocator [Aurantivibrio infirmus]
MMDILQIFSFIVVATLLVISPGPNGVLIARTVPIAGRNAGFVNISGFVAAFCLHGSLSVLGISILLVQSAQLFLVVKLLGAIYLCWIGIKSLISAWRYDATIDIQSQAYTKPKLGNAFIEGFLTNALNPKVSMFYLAAFPQFISASAPTSSAFLLVFIHALINILWFSGMIVLLAKLKIVGSSVIFQRAIKTITGCVFIGFGAKLATLKP